MRYRLLMASGALVAGMMSGEAFAEERAVQNPGQESVHSIFVMGNGVRPEHGYPCDVEFHAELKDKTPWPFENVGFVYYPHRVEALADVYAQNIAFIKQHIVPYAPGLVFSGATVQHGDVTFRPEDGPTDLGIAEPFNKPSIERQVNLLTENGIVPARHLSLAGMIQEQLPADAEKNGWVTGLKHNSEGPIRGGHTMVKPNYDQPGVRDYLRETFAILSRDTGYRYYWMDNWVAEDPAMNPLVYKAVREGAKAAGAPVILRSGAGPAQVGLTDIIAPAPDIQHAWTHVTGIFNSRAVEPFVRYCPNAFKLGFDDFYINAPFSRDQARFLATMHGLPGIEVTVTEGEFFKTPLDRIAMIQQILPLPCPGPLQDAAPKNPHVWIEKIHREFGDWSVAGFFNDAPFAQRKLQLSLADAGMSDGIVIAWDYWDRRMVGLFQGKIDVNLPPASCLALVLHKRENRPQLLATDRHLLGGAEEIHEMNWSATDNTLSGTFTRGVDGKAFNLYVYCPVGYKLASAEGAVQKTAIDDGIVVATLEPKAGNLTWTLRFEPTGAKAKLKITSEPITNTLGHIVTQNTNVSQVRTDHGMTTTECTIPSQWKDQGDVRFWFTVGKVDHMSCNGVECLRLENPAKAYTAWYTTLGESVFTIPADAIHWDQPNQIFLTPTDPKANLTPSGAGLRLDL